MKVIDLLNKIANGEEVPERIKYYDINYKYDLYDYFNEDKDDDNEPLSYWIDFSNKHLNSEVEIIEDTPKEDKKIEKLKYIGETVKEDTILRKINEIIDKVNGDINED